MKQWEYLVVRYRYYFDDSEDEYITEFTANDKEIAVIKTGTREVPKGLFRTKTETTTDWVQPSWAGSDHLTLNHFGSLGWELISIKDDGRDEFERRKIDYLFKRIAQ